MPVKLGPGINPLRDPEDRRLNRIAGPSGLIIFGVTGDLSRKKLMPGSFLPVLHWLALLDASGKTRISPR